MLEVIESQMLASLEKQWQAGDREALERFWEEVQRIGTPLVEDIPGEDEVLVSFLWRDRGGDEPVYVFGGVAGWNFEACLLQRLADTDVLYRTVKTGKRLPATYHVSVHDQYGEDVQARIANFQPDPYNRYDFYHPRNPDQAESTDVSLGCLRFLDVPSSPYLVPNAAAAQGRLDDHRFHSEILNEERTIWVYQPPVDPSVPCQLLVLFDGLEYHTLIPTPAILDNLLAEGTVQPTVVVFINNRSRVEELQGKEDTTRFVVEEVLPYVRARYNVTNDRTKTAIGGCGFGGIGSFYAACRYPDVFDTALAQSGNFGWGPEGDTSWLLDVIAAEPQLPTRFYFDIGTLEPDRILLPNRRMREVLDSLDREVHYVEFVGGHDFLCWRETFPAALRAMLAERNL